VIALSGCASSKSTIQNDKNSGEYQLPTSWFCEDLAGEWDCAKLTKSEIELRRKPRMNGTSSDKKQNEPSSENSEPTMVAPFSEPAEVPNLQIEKMPPLTEEQDAEQISMPTDEKLDRENTTVSVPIGKLMNVSEEFWAVQILALRDKEQLERFIEDRDLTGTRTAKIASSGEIFYVLITGIYESRALAEAATVDFSDSISSLTPYIRSIRSLQQAIKIAQDL
jgi:septal ring-binding cell division protein DamX